ncbi:hypothetical protein AB6A40_010731 [Gnathostoma spinigerum]|uniref:Uncharacterized protein n=1 Tax=Gnathostoma spinigerum TaxID=75299 RepID=A0ABD6F392_9BILA
MDEDQPSLFTVSAATNVRDGEMEGNGDSQMMDQLQTPPTETTNVLAKDEHDYKIRTRVIKRLGPEDRYKWFS